MTKECFLIIFGTSLLNILIGAIMMMATGDPMGLTSFVMAIFWTVITVFYFLGIAWESVCRIILKRTDQPLDLEIGSEIAK